MVIANSTNLFGLSPYIVDPSDANGSYTTIQAAINAVTASGADGKIFVRQKATGYVENLSITSNMEIIGVSAAGDYGTEPGLPSVVVTIDGQHTVTNDAVVVFSNLWIRNSIGVGSALTVAPSNSSSFVTCNNCLVESTGGGSAINLAPTLTGDVRFFLNDSSVHAQAADCIVGIAQTTLFAKTSIINSTGAGGHSLNTAGNASLKYCFCSSISVPCINVTGTGIVSDFYGNYNSQLTECIAVAAGSTFNANFSSIDANIVSGLYITGSGNYNYSNVATIGISKGIDSALTTTIQSTSGTFRPDLTFGGGSFGIGYATQNGRWSQVSNIVFFQIDIVLTSKGSDTGSAGITISLPSPTMPPIDFSVSGPTSILNGDTPLSPPLFLSANSASGWEILGVGGAGPVVTVTDANFSNTSTLSINGFYFV